MTLLERWKADRQENTGYSTLEKGGGREADTSHTNKQRQTGEVETRGGWEKQNETQLCTVAVGTFAAWMTLDMWRRDMTACVETFIITELLLKEIIRQSTVQSCMTADLNNQYNGCVSCGKALCIVLNGATHFSFFAAGIWEISNKFNWDSVRGFKDLHQSSQRAKHNNNIFRCNVFNCQPFHFSAAAHPFVCLCVIGRVYLWCESVYTGPSYCLNNGAIFGKS